MQMCTHTFVIASLFLFSHTLKYKQLFLSRCQNATDTKSLFSEYWLLSSFKISHCTFPLFPAFQFGCSFILPITGIGLSPLLASEPWCSSCKHHWYWTNRTMGVIILIISYSNPMVKHSHTRSSMLCVCVCSWSSVVHHSMTFCNSLLSLSGQLFSLTPHNASFKFLSNPSMI